MVPPYPPSPKRRHFAPSELIRPELTAQCRTKGEVRNQNRLNLLLYGKLCSHPGKPWLSGACGGVEGQKTRPTLQGYSVDTSGILPTPAGGSDLPLGGQTGLPGGDPGESGMPKHLEDRPRGSESTLDGCAHARSLEQPPVALRRKLTRSFPPR